ncbi:MutL_C domain-containing protein/HATPase_c_3 domain-containing protein [Cephalotus follicularis]|uniref:MutL_C domain-containing protein/HATPase_c_3 domain-containing protein n=1 Tax=Cephalotus follicularis TaxID=3775 RepID=A0A1Q3CSJ1_CEPFO|nr:MutL_C domain-containing protein/HATPase_c_3 domain-containing protein [Cephalotus follicularis]
MRIIKQLPESVHSTVRSGIILFDLTRVVEELIFNSLDAAATKVSVFVGVGTCYVKVVDDGFGISRDGLELLGERYATSKFCHLADMDALSGSFGFRGEALASISDVSLLEIVTRTYGRPNGYCKVIKGSKCLHLGIDDKKTDVGTTVVVRDLFYNQPVRRRNMQSSPKKVLHSVKKCVLRIALVHPKVSLKVVDVESEYEILRTHSSSSALSQLMSGFGIEDSSSLHELNTSNGLLKLFGYISGPCDNINSRFVCKGPIHKLLNRLAARFECFDPWKLNMSKKVKRSRSQAYPAYMVNLCCPRSLYDITFEPSKTYAEFKDWKPILSFIEEDIQHLWGKNVTHRQSYNGFAGVLEKDEMWKEDVNVMSVEGDLFDADLHEDFKFTINSWKTPSHQDCIHLPSAPKKLLTKEADHWFLSEHERIAFPEFHKNTAELTRNPWTDNNFLLAESSLLESRSTSAEKNNNHLESKLSSLQWGYKSLNVEAGVSKGFAGIALSFDCHEFSNGLEVGKDIRKPFLQSCSSRESLPFDGPESAAEEGFALSSDGMRTKRKRLCPNERVDIFETDVDIQYIDLISRTMWQEEASSIMGFPKFVTNNDMLTGSDLTSRASVNSFISNREPFAEEDAFLSDSAGQVGNSGSNHQFLHSGWCSVSSDPLSWDVESFTKNDALEDSSRLGKRATYGHFSEIEEKGHSFSYDIMSRKSNRENYTSSCTSTVLDYRDYTDSIKYFCKINRGNNIHSKFSPEHSDRVIEDTLCLCSDLYGADCTNINKHESRRDQQFRHYFPKERSTRSHSAPPFYKWRRRFISLNHYSVLKAGNSDPHTISDTFPSPGVIPDMYFPFSHGAMMQSLPICLPNMKNETDAEMDMKEIQKHEKLEQPKFSRARNEIPVEDYISRGIQDSINPQTKWRNSCPETANLNRSSDIHDQNNILDISSGFLNLAGDSLVPRSINKSCLKDARVLPQVDKKFIPIVAGGTLAVIDQHAADERIRLEELRQKVLSGEEKTVAYLDAEQELILPEIGYQLLHNYAEQIKDWGWICDSHSQGSRTFKKSLNLLHKRQNIVQLLAVPCILGVNLSDLDLLEYLQQLADTDGSSTLPPSVLRILNYKACRGAIMFGDSLMPSECSLIVDELKQTSLCFQCAHGRPTTVPLVNLEALHKQIAKLGVLDDGSSELWHGLRRNKPTLERAAQRLTATTLETNIIPLGESL